MQATLKDKKQQEIQNKKILISKLFFDYQYCFYK